MEVTDIINRYALYARIWKDQSHVLLRWIEGQAIQHRRRGDCHTWQDMPAYKDLETPGTLPSHTPDCEYRLNPSEEIHAAPTPPPQETSKPSKPI